MTAERVQSVSTRLGRLIAHIWAVSCREKAPRLRQPSQYIQTTPMATLVLPL